MAYDLTGADPAFLVTDRIFTITEADQVLDLAINGVFIASIVVVDHSETPAVAMVQDADWELVGVAVGATLARYIKITKAYTTSYTVGVTYQLLNPDVGNKAFNIVVDKYYKFELVYGFDTLNGIYKVLQTLSYAEVVDSSIDMVVMLYGKTYPPKTQAEYEIARSNYLTDTFYKLQSVLDETVVIMVPGSLLARYPNASVDQFCNIMLNIDLGLFANQDDLDTIGQIITEQLHSRLGIDPHPQIAIYDKTWMTDAEYDIIEAARLAARGNVVNYYSEATRLTTLNEDKDAKIAALEAIIVNLQTA